MRLKGRWPTYMAPSTHPELSVMHIPGPTGLGKCERTESIIAVGRQRLHVELERYRVVGINRASWGGRGESRNTQRRESGNARRPRPLLLFLKELGPCIISMPRPKKSGTPGPHRHQRRCGKELNPESPDGIVIFKNIRRAKIGPQSLKARSVAAP